MKTWRMRIAAGVGAVLVTSGLGVLPGAPAAAANGITWPSIGQVNPGHTFYAVTVDAAVPAFVGIQWSTYSGSGVGAIQWVQPGTTPVDFTGVPDGTGQLTALSCPTQAESPQCQRIDISRSIQIWRSMYLDTTGVTGRPARSPGVALVQGVVKPSGTVPGNTTYSLLDAAGAVVASGPATWTHRLGDSWSVDVQVPAGLADGEYRVSVPVEGDHPTLGHLAGSPKTAPTVKVDNTPAPLGLRLVRVQDRREVDQTVIYPFRDGYVDTVDVDVDVPGEDLQRLVVSVLDGGGQRVVTLMSKSGLDIYNGARKTWRGTNDAGSILPPGAYTVVAQAVDLAGNESSISRPITVSDKRLVARTWRRKFKASKAVVDTYVGKCSTLARPGRRWKGSLGLYSQTKCRDAQQSAVVVIGGAYIPEAFTGDYERIRVSTYGGPARRGSYVVLGHHKRGNDVVDRKVIWRKTKWHKLAWNSTPRKLVRRDKKSKRPFVLWYAGLTQGSRFDIRSFRVEVRRKVLVSPTGDSRAESDLTYAARPGMMGHHVRSDLASNVGPE